jgi:spermidine synthase
VNASEQFAQTVQTKSGTINVTSRGQVFGHGAYDGAFNTDLIQDKNLVIRAYFLGAIHPKPEEVLVIGLASGSWAQVFAHHPDVRSVTIVEINPGYLDVVAANPLVASLLTNPKVKIFIDDGRRWLAHHDERRFDAIVANTTQHWRSHVTNLLSVEFLKLVQSRLKPNGIYYFNATGSNEAQRTAALAFPHALRVSSMVAVSDSPISVDRSRWRRLLANYRIDNRPTFRPDDPLHRERFEQVLALAVDFGAGSHAPPDEEPFLERREHILSRTEKLPIITDDNMFTEWKDKPPGPLPASLRRIKELLIGVTPRPAS